MYLYVHLWLLQKEAEVRHTALACFSFCCPLDNSVSAHLVTYISYILCVTGSLQLKLIFIACCFISIVNVSVQLVHTTDNTDSTSCR